MKPTKEDIERNFKLAEEGKALDMPLKVLDGALYYKAYREANREKIKAYRGEKMKEEAGWYLATLFIGMMIGFVLGQSINMPKQEYITCNLTELRNELPEEDFEIQLSNCCGSMRPTITKGDELMQVTANLSDIKVGDIVIYNEPVSISKGAHIKLYEWR